MPLDVDDTVRKEPEEEGAKKQPGAAHPVDSELRIALERLGSKPRRPRQDTEIPREAKISFALGISVIVILIAIPIVSIVLRKITAEDAPPPPAPGAATPGPVATNAPPKPKTSSGSSGTSLPAEIGGASTPGQGPVELEPPMPPHAFAILRGLQALANEASHLAPGVEEGSIDPATVLPEGCLDGASTEVITNLQLFELRVARQPVVAMRVTSWSPNGPAASAYSVELMSSLPTGEELVSRGTVVIGEPVGGTAHLVGLSELEPFDATGVFITALSYNNYAADADTQKPADNGAPQPSGAGILLPGQGAAAPFPAEGVSQRARYPFVLR